MKPSIVAACCLAVALFASAPAFALGPVTTVFPPDNETSCTDTGSKFLSWYSGAGASHCSSGQDILSSAIPTCSNGQMVVYENNKFICKTQANVPSCNPNEFLNFDGQTYTCKSTGVATCGNNQVLTFNGSSYYCVNRDATIPVCGAKQFLTYNGNYQCATVDSPTVPNCGAGQYVTSIGGQFGCADLATIPAAHDEFVAIVTLQQFHHGCTTDNLTGTPFGYMQCSAACHRYCANSCTAGSSDGSCDPVNSGMHYAGGVLAEWDGNGGNAACTCFH